MSSFARTLRRALEHRALPWVAGLLSAVLLVQALGAGFIQDDHFQRFRLLGLGEPAIHLFEFYDGDPVRNRVLMDEGRLPWWSSEDLRHKNFRYVSVLTMLLDFALWPETPALMHLHSLLWLAAAVAALGFLYRGLIGATWAAGLATLCYALEDAHFAPAQYLANRNALIATCAGVLCIWSFDRWRREGWRPGAFTSPVFLAISLGAAEIGAATTAYLASYAFFVERDSWPRRILAQAPCVMVVGLYVVIYAAFGFGSSGSGFYNNPLQDPAGFMSLLWQRIPVLLLGQWTVIPADFVLSSDPTTGAPATLQRLGLGVIVVLALSLAPLLVRDRLARFWGVGALLSLIPISATGPQNRLLFFAGIGSFALLAMFLDDLIAHFRTRSHLWKWPATAVAVFLLLNHVVLAPWAGLLTAEHQRWSEGNLRTAIASVPDDPALTEQELVLVNPPDHTYTVGVIRSYRETRGEPSPRLVRALSVGSSPIEVTRIDARTLDLRLEYGLFSTPISRYFRSADRGFEVGERARVADLEIEIRDLAGPGNPGTLRYRFPVPLEDDSLRWLRWNERVYEPFELPKQGETVRLAPGKGIFDPD